MELFQFFRKFSEMMGVLPINQNQTYSINFKILSILIVLLHFFMSSMVFLIFKSKSIGEYEYSFFMSISAIVGIALFLITIWKMPIISNLIAEFQEIIEKSE